MQIIDLTIGLRLSKAEEEIGADVIEHGVQRATPSLKFSDETVETLQSLLHHGKDQERNGKIDNKNKHDTGGGMMAGILARAIHYDASNLMR